MSAVRAPRRLRWTLPTRPRTPPTRYCKPLVPWPERSVLPGDVDGPCSRALSSLRLPCQSQQLFHAGSCTVPPPTALAVEAALANMRDARVHLVQLSKRPVYGVIEALALSKGFERQTEVGPSHLDKLRRGHVVALGVFKGCCQESAKSAAFSIFSGPGMHGSCGLLVDIRVCPSQNGVHGLQLGRGGLRSGAKVTQGGLRSCRGRPRFGELHFEVGNGAR